MLVWCSTIVKCLCRIEFLLPVNGDNLTRLNSHPIQRNSLESTLHGTQQSTEHTLDHGDNLGVSVVVELVKVLKVQDDYLAGVVEEKPADLTKQRLKLRPEQTVDDLDFLLSFVGSEPKVQVPN